MQTPGTHTPSGAAAPDSTMLLPPLSALLPPISPLLPAGDSLAKGGIAAASGFIAGDGSKADETLEQLGQQLNRNLREISGRTSSFVAHQAPRVQAARRSATAYINRTAHELGHKAAQELGDAESRRSFVQKYRNWLLAGCGGCVGLLMAGWGMAHHFASEKARTAVHDALQSASLLGTVQYDDVSASPLGNVSIYGVKWHVSPDVDIHIASVNLSNIDKARPVPYHIDIQAKGMEIPVSKMVTHGDATGPAGDLIRSLARLGYNTVTGTMDMAYSLRDRQSEMTVRTSGALDGCGSWTVSADLGQVSPALLDPSLVSMLNRNMHHGNPIMLINALQDVYRITLQNTEFTLDMTDLTRRGRELPDTPLPPDATAQAAMAREQTRQEEMARSKGLSDEQAHMFALLQSSQASAFTLKTDNRNPVRIMDLTNTSLLDFMLRTNATLSR